MLFYIKILFFVFYIRIVFTVNSFFSPNAIDPKIKFACQLTLSLPTPRTPPSACRHQACCCLLQFSAIITACNGQKVPLIYVRWTDVPDDILEYIWREVQDNTNASDEYKPYCLRTVGDRWKDWKARVKQKWYTPFIHCLYINKMKKKGEKIDRMSLYIETLYKDEWNYT
ncbi:Plant transposase [Melia azedarach]|uniref:Plant transposase n=1 Tax=Melia azedarach TaxID=155640 RepID=A0ACC1YIX2_MELAZ|nr:Plant transposase [Melia azedarach]